MKKFSILSILVLLLLSACRDPFLDEPFIEYTGEDLELSNAEFLKKYEDKYSLWIQLLKHADMFNALNDASSVSTVFAPDNQAVENFLEWRGVESVEELDFEYARYVAQVHILAQNLPEAVFISYVEDGSIPIKTVFGTYLSTSYGFMDNEVDDIFLPQVMVQDSLSIYLNNQAKVTALARTTANGQVYTLGAVIRPLAESILDILAPYREYDIFIEAARLTEYDKIVSVYADTVYNLDGSFSVNNIRFTCFAVPDSVYNQAGISSAEELAAHLGAGQNYTDTLNALYQYMSYHFLGQTYSKAALFNFRREGQILIFDTKLPGQVIISEHVEGESKINKVAKIIRSGIQARNGVIHKIDHIMPVYEPDPITVVWDFCNYPDIESFVNTYGASKNLGDLFSSPLTNREYPVDLSEDQLDGNNGTLTSILYKANAAKTSYKTWRKVGFLKCAYNSSRDKENNKYDAYMNTLLTLNLGYAGWIQLQTPTIIKGKYKVVFYYASSISFKNYYGAGSLTKFNLDDYQKSIYMWKGLPAKFTDEAKRDNENASGLAEDILWDEVVFDYSGRHSFKATMMDINAKTSGSYRQMWDYIEFIPISD
ncbi:MAG: DUF5108 domain-containing protein [Bacteroidales bacterium]|nr:DUF5108 domain-containing protein [Bacteroidales bacterium]MDD4640476.1 DUF5108 domain-containing protein [Bacteroidales bacterium]